MSETVKKLAPIILVAVAAAAFYLSIVQTPDQPEVQPEPPEEKPAGGQLICAVPGMVGNLFPFQVTDPATRLASHLIHEPLAAYGPTGTLRPILATNWHSEDDGRTWEIHLRPGVKWHDDEPFTADDVLHTHKSIRDEDNLPSPLAHLFGNLESTEKIDRYSVRLHLFNPRRTLPQLATVPLIAVHWGSSYRQLVYNHNPVGTGPFQLEKWSPHTSTVLEANSSYWGGQPHLDSIKLVPFEDDNLRVQSVESGYADCTWTWSETRLQDTADLKIEAIPSWETLYLAIPPNTPFLQDSSVRRTIDAIIRSALQNRFSPETIAGHPWPQETQLEIISEQQPGKDNSPTSEDLRQKLEEMGWVLSDRGVRYKDGEPAQFILLVPDWRNLPDIAKWIQKELSQYDIAVEVEIMHLSEVDQKLQDRSYEAILVQVQTGPDPDLHHLLSSTEISGGYNDSMYYNPEMNRLLAQFRKSSLSKREELAKSMLDLLKADMPAVWMQWPQHYILVCENVGGLQWGPGPTLWESHRIFMHELDNGS